MKKFEAKTRWIALCGLLFALALTHDIFASKVNPKNEVGESASPQQTTGGDEQEPAQELKEGQTPEEVQKILGQPEDTTTLKESLIYTYPTVKVFFENGKLVDVQQRPEAKKKFLIPDSKNSDTPPPSDDRLKLKQRDIHKESSTPTARGPELEKEERGQKSAAPAIYVEEISSTGTIIAASDTALEAIKTLQEKGMRVVTIKEKADYILQITRQLGKKSWKKDTKVALSRRDGEVVFANSTRTVGGAMGDVADYIHKHHE